MGEKIGSSPDHLNGPPDYSQKIADFLAQNYPDVALPERTVQLMAGGFGEAYAKYGRGQTAEKRHEYHNDEHAFEVFERGVAWLRRFEEHFDVTFTAEDYEVVGIAAAWHDNVIGAADEETGDEALSAQAVVEIMRSAPTKFSAKMRRRVKQAIEATTVEYRNGEVLQTHVITGKPDFAVVAIALADSSAILTESEDKIIEDVSKLALERLPYGATDVTATTDAVMKILTSEEKFVSQRLDDLQKYLEFLSDDPESAKRIFERYFASRREHLLRFAARIDGQLSDIQQTVTDALIDSKETTERAASKIHRGILRGLAWLPPTE